MLNRLENQITKIYGELYSKEEIQSVARDINDMIIGMKAKNINLPKSLDHKDSYLITYGDSFKRNGEMPLETMKEFNKNFLKDLITEIHILPHFPFSSDDGFSVIDYEEVNPEFGDWKMIKSLSEDTNLMFDYVINHISSESPWFKKYLAGEEKYKNFFVTKEDDWDYSNVVRPRTSPLFHEYEAANGEKKNVWTTFSDDQIDLNFKDLTLLRESIRILLFYAEMGMTSIRLDAIGFLWKENGSTCIHLEPTHEVIKLWRMILDEISENYKIITETNVPFKENISYFGNQDEAHMVYQFSLPPLAAFSILKGDATKLTQWAKSLEEFNDKKSITFFNFLSSHDGIGMRPVEGILNDDEVEFMKDTTLAKGGQTSNRTNNGKETVYELNINYFSMLKENDELDLERFMASQAILLSMRGVPAIYYHSLLGSENYEQGFIESGIKRRINREKLDYDILEKELNDESTNRNKVYSTFKNLMTIRSQEKAFNPYGEQNVLELSPNVFAFERVYEGEKITVIINITDSEVNIENTNLIGTEIISGTEINNSINLKPYQTMWIK